jgi:hypothetical protein
MRDAGEPTGPTTENATFGRVSVEDVRSLVADQSQELPEGSEIGNRMRITSQ